MVSHEAVSIAVPALRVIGNILCSNDTAITIVPIEAGVLTLFNDCLAHQKQ